MSALYTIFIYPLELFFEVVFSIANRIVGHPGFAIIILSLAVNFLVLPLYKRADEVQKEERDLEASLADGIAHIKKTFKGDERMMMLNTYYAQNNYSPLYVLKGSVSLLLQIPFFMAAYRFLSNLRLLRGVSFGPIHDLGAPDQMLVLFGIGINVLPILMTLINFISGYIYTKGMPLKSKVQLYAMAIVFLVLLYNSPSGLAFYWTLNNVFSMLKNVFYRFKRPGFVLAWVVAAAGGIIMLFVNTIYDSYPSRQLKLTLIGALLLVPLIVLIIKGKSKSSVKIFDKIQYTKSNRNIFILSGLFLTALIGLLIPSAVVRSSPTEFMDLMNLVSPNTYVIHAALIAAGYFIVWGSVFFYLAGGKARAVISQIWWALCPACAVTYLFFGTKLGTLTDSLMFETPFSYSLVEKAVNALLIIAAIGVFVLVFNKWHKFAEGLALILALVCVVMSFSNMNLIRKSYDDLAARTDVQMPSIPLSTEGRNVMILMIDRAPGFLVPYIFNEIPELQEQFDGFSFYPNTLSFGTHTKHATPSLFGGYDYTPGEICADEGKTLRQTQNEALSVMPLLFRDEGFEVTLCDPPYADYMSPPGIELFDGAEYDGINAYITEGALGALDFNGSRQKLWERNFFCYALLKVSPLFMQSTVYNNGNYNMTDTGITDELGFTIPQIAYGPSVSVGVNEDALEAYTVLANLASITEIEQGDSDTFMYIDNETPHSTMLLQEPAYAPAQNVDNTEYDASHADRFDEPVNGYVLQMDSYNCMRHYESNVAAYVLLGQYFDYLREAGVWDNTRIIVVADHGTMAYDVAFFGDQTNLETMSPISLGFESFNPVLMVKDFGSTGFTVCDDLMTNADVPYIATSGLIENPVNPFTGNPLTTHLDQGFPICVYNSNDSNVTDTPADGNATRFTSDDWYAFEGTRVLDADAWTYMGVS